MNRPLTVYTYDNLGEVTETQVYNGDGISPTISSGELSLPDGASSDLQAQTVTSYNSQGRVYQTQVYSVNPTDGDVSSTALTTENYYDPSGQLLATSEPGGLWTKYACDGAGRAVMAYQTDGGSGTSYSEAGSLATDLTAITGTQSVSETWTYDALGNHLQDSTTTTGTTTVTSTFNYDNQIASISSGTTPTYDADGNMTTDQSGLQYVYDAWGHVVTVKNSGGTTLESYSYDGRGFRMTNTVGSTTTNLLNSTAEQVLEEQAASSGYYTARYVWSVIYVNQMIDRDTDTSGTGLTATGSAFARAWPLADADYNTVALVVMSGGSATAVERYAYDPFGAVTYMDGSYTVLSASAYGWVYLFQGGRLDGMTGLTHFGARNEDSALGVWTSHDPLGFKGGDVVLYGFEGNRLIGWVDPTGERGLREWWSETWVANIGAAWDGAVDGAAMFANAATFHQIGSLDRYVTSVKATGGWMYKYGDWSMHLGAHALHVAGAVYVWTAVGMPTAGIGWTTQTTAAQTGGTAVAGSCPSFHVSWGILQNGSMVWRGAYGVGDTVIEGLSATPVYWTSLTGLPVLSSTAVASAPAVTCFGGGICLTSAVNAVARGLWKFW